MKKQHLRRKHKHHQADHHESEPDVRTYERIQLEIIRTLTEDSEITISVSELAGGLVTDTDSSIRSHRIINVVICGKL